MNPAEFRAALKAAQITQRQFAQAAGIHETTVSRWLSGDMPLPEWVALAFDGLQWRKLVAWIESTSWK